MSARRKRREDSVYHRRVREFKRQLFVEAAEANDHRADWIAAALGLHRTSVYVLQRRYAPEVEIVDRRRFTRVPGRLPRDLRAEKRSLARARAEADLERELATPLVS